MYPEICLRQLTTVTAVEFDGSILMPSIKNLSARQLSFLAACVVQYRYFVPAFGRNGGIAFDGNISPMKHEFGRLQTSFTSTNLYRVMCAQCLVIDGSFYALMNSED